MSRLGELSGSPWHVEKMVRHEGDERRHKTHCKYYRKKDSFCIYQNITCSSTIHCKYYDVGEFIGQESEADDTKKVNLKNKEKKNQKSYKELRKKVPIGAKIYHNKYGEGIVKEYIKQYIEVDFEGDRKKLDLKMCIEKKIIKIICE